MKELKELREQIDDLDDQILGLLERRCAVCYEIGRKKKTLDLQIYDGPREREVIHRLKQRAIYPDIVEQIWPCIMQYCKSFQE